MWLLMMLEMALFDPQTASFMPHLVSIKHNYNLYSDPFFRIKSSTLALCKYYKYNLLDKLSVNSQKVLYKSNLYPLVFWKSSKVHSISQILDQQLQSFFPHRILKHFSANLFITVDMGCQDDLVTNVCEIYEKLSRLESLKPSKEVNMIFTKLVEMCVPPNPVEVTKLPKQVQEMRSKLIKICGEAEGLMESHYSAILGSFKSPLDHLDLFPYHTNYIKLGQLEFNILKQHYTHIPAKIAFIGSGPLPLTSVVLATKHLTNSTFHNFDIDESANSLARSLVSANANLSERMVFHTADIMSVTDTLKEYEVVFLAALVGMDKEAKNQVIDHLAKHMAPGAILMLRSAHGARAFLYPVIDPCDLRGFEVLSIYHPTDEVINSVVIARKTAISIHTHDHGRGGIFLPCKCSNVNQPFNHGNMIEELTVEELL